jgi:hypothetical protein
MFDTDYRTLNMIISRSSIALASSCHASYNEDGGRGMITRYPKTMGQTQPEKENRTAEEHAVESKDDDCRCKEASNMTPRELLKLMISDLAFWSKKGR